MPFVNIRVGVIIEIQEVLYLSFVTHYLGSNCCFNNVLIIISAILCLRRLKKSSGNSRLLLQNFVLHPSFVKINKHYNDVIMGAIGSQITSLHDYSLNRLSGTDQRKHQSSASLAFVRGIHRWPVDSPHKWPVTRKMFPFDDVIMNTLSRNTIISCYYRRSPFMAQLISLREIGMREKEWLMLMKGNTGMCCKHKYNLTIFHLHHFVSFWTAPFFRVQSRTMWLKFNYQPMRGRRHHFRYKTGTE